jgi:hypothetical protein
VKAATPALALALLLACAPQAAAQEFDPVLDVGGSALAFLAQGLPPADRATRFELSAVRWDGLGELTGGAVAAHVARGPLHVGAGVAHVGADDLAWNAGAVAVGGGGAPGGAALTAIVRRPDVPQGSTLDARLGIEAGGGAWIALAPGWRAWASDPGAWSSGVAPPLAPALELGVSARVPGLVAWAARAGSRGGGAHRAGLGLALGTAGAWLEARDQPLRGALGVWTASHGLALALRADAHPVLAPTMRVLIAIGGAPW